MGGVGGSGRSCGIDGGIALHERGDAGRPVPLQHIGVAARPSREESSRQTSPLGKGLVQLCPSRRRWEENGKRGDPGDAGSVPQRSRNGHLPRKALGLLSFSLSLSSSDARRGLLCWPSAEGSAAVGTGSCAASSSGWRWRAAP